MFNYYWQERTFYYRTIEEIENHLNRITEIIAKADDYDHFYKSKTFCSFPYGRHDTIGNVLFEKLKNEQLKLRIVPAILKRFASIDESFVQQNQMQDRFPSYFNAFFGPKFVNVNKAVCYLVHVNDYQFFRDSNLENTVDTRNIEKYHHIVSKQVILTSEAIKMVKSKGGCVRKLFEAIKELQKYIDGGNWTGRFDEHDVSQKTKINISDESDSVKRNPQFSKYRLFPVPNHGNQYCFLHIKDGTDTRFVIYPDEKEKKVYVVYVGTHLPTQKYK